MTHAEPAVPWRRALADAAALALPFWRQRSQRRAWALAAAVLALTLGTVALNVRFSAWNNAFYDALQNHDGAAFRHQLAVFSLLAAAYIAAAVYRQYLQQRLQLRWRLWLTDQLMAQWLRPGVAYRLGSAWRGSAGAAPDNPDQRIAEDVQQFVSGSLSLTLGLLNAGVTLLSFVAILWRLSGRWPLALAGHQVEVPGAMVGIALVYAGGGSWLAQRIGHPLVGLGVQQQRVEADLRYALVQLRDHAEAIALARGEDAEHRRLAGRLAAVGDNAWRLITATKRLTWFSAGYGQLAVVFPLLAAAPRYFAGQIALGGLMQTAQAFGQVQGALSWFVDAYPALADWRATVQRLAGFRAALREEAQAPAEAPRWPPADPRHAIELECVRVKTPDRRLLLDVPYAAVARGERLVLSGVAGQGKSSLLRTLAGLWPPAAGRIRSAGGQRWMVVPQRPYLPAATLHEALCWPAPAQDDDPAPWRPLLRRVGLPALAHELDRHADWARVLSPGEQQRLQFARVLHARPDLLLLDEATSALDPASQDLLLALLVHALPSATVVCVSHRPVPALAAQGAWHVAQGRLHTGPPAAPPAGSPEAATGTLVRPSGDGPASRPRA